MILAADTATILTIVVAAVSATWAYGRSISDTELRIPEVELKVSEVELRLSTAIKDSEIRTLEMLADMRKENQSAHDRIVALVTDLRVEFAEFAASRPGHEHGRLAGNRLLRGLNRVGRHPQLPAQYTPQLVMHRLAHDQGVIGDDGPERIRADAPRRHGTHQDVRVEEDPQEMSRKTSSSVR